MPGGYCVRDANGQALAFLYSRDNDAEARQAKVLTKDEARQVARVSGDLNDGPRHASFPLGTILAAPKYRVQKIFFLTDL
jgi:hypothetical protein